MANFATTKHGSQVVPVKLCLVASYNAIDLVENHLSRYWERGKRQAQCLLKHGTCRLAGNPWHLATGNLPILRLVMAFIFILWPVAQRFCAPMAQNSDPVALDGRFPLFGSPSVAVSALD